MQLNVVNSAAIQQPVLTDAGAPILNFNPLPPTSVAPTFNLPKDGQRPEDKHPKNKNPYVNEANESEVKQDELPENFKLVLAPDFFEIFKSFYESPQGDLAYKQRLFRLSNGMKEHKVYSTMYQKIPNNRVKRDLALEQTVMYHKSRPGSRFIGQI